VAVRSVVYFFGKYGAVLLILLTVYSYMVVSRTAEGHLYDNISEVPEREVGLLLGTSERARSGRPNLFFWNRVDAAVELLNAGKIEFILASGDRQGPYYSEPESMYRALVERGVPPERIVLDPGGFTTLDSVLRAGAGLEGTQVTVISQRFHTVRALYIAHRRGVDAIAYNAMDVGGSAGASVQFREVFARVRAVADVEVLRREPRLSIEEAPFETPAERGLSFRSGRIVPAR